MVRLVVVASKMVVVVPGMGIERGFMGCCCCGCLFLLLRRRWLSLLEVELLAMRGVGWLELALELLTGGERNAP